MKGLAALLIVCSIACSKKKVDEGHAGSAAPPSSEGGVTAQADAGAVEVDAMSANSGSGSAAATSSEPAEARAKALLDRQIAAIKDRKDAELIATFTPDAVILNPTAEPAAHQPSQLTDTIPRLAGHRTLKDIKVTKLVAGGNPNVAWFSAELEIEFTDEGGKRTQPLRVLELIDGSGKAITASFGDIKALSGGVGGSDLEGMTQPGPLSKLLTSVDEAAAALANDPSVSVQGTDKGEYAIGPDAAKKQLAKWSKLKLSLDKNQAREVRTATYGYALANVNMPDPAGGDFNMTGLVIAIPNGDKWSVVGVHYLP